MFERNEYDRHIRLIIKLESNVRYGVMITNTRYVPVIYRNYNFYDKTLSVFVSLENEKSNKKNNVYIKKAQHKKQHRKIIIDVDM